MKRTLYALLICAATVCVVLVVAIALERALTPNIVHDFVRHAFGGDSEEAQEDRRQTLLKLQSERSQPHLYRMLKRYAFMLGAFVEIKGESAPRDLAGNLVEFEIQAAFEKMDADVHVYLQSDGGAWEIYDFDINIPEAHEMAPQLRWLKHLAKLLSEQLARRNPADFYDYLPLETRAVLGLRAFGEPFYEKIDVIGEFEKLEPLGEPEKIAKNEYRYGYRLIFSDKTLILRHRWRFHEIMWLCEELTLEYEDA